MASKPPQLNGIVFVTGTDTGAGKTLLTAMLIAHLRAAGVNALAMKPFCSGGTEDLEVLAAMQGPVLSRNELNPFYFEAPIAPLAAANRGDREIVLEDVLEAIAGVKSKCDVLLIEGSGGVMVPLGKNLLVVDLIRALRCPVIVAGRNRLGIINHAILTVSALQVHTRQGVNLALMGVPVADLSAKTNRNILRNLLPFCFVEELPFVRDQGSSASRAKKSFRKFQKTLARLLEFDSLHVRSLRVGSRQKTVDRKKFKKSVDGSSK